MSPLPRTCRCALFLLVLTVTACIAAPPDAIDAVVEAAMKSQHIPGLSLAVARNGAIVSTRAWGVTRPDGNSPVTAETLFQAASISKCLTALGALLLVERGSLSLDGNVNDRLVSWKVPENSLTATQKVTVGRILSHTAGFTIHGFDGYEAGETIPSLRQILEGTKPANSGPVVVAGIPGSAWKYSGGGYVVLQQLMTDVTGQPFDQWMQRNVLAPLGMTHSSFHQPLPGYEWSRAAWGRNEDGTPVTGGWHVYPEMAAAGLWTTPTDLVRFETAIQNALRGTGPVPPEVAKLMTTPVLKDDAMGFFVLKGPVAIYRHNGRNAGFDSFIAFDTNTAAAVMANSNINSNALWKIVSACLSEYHNAGNTITEGK